MILRGAVVEQPIQNPGVWGSNPSLPDPEAAGLEPLTSAWWSKGSTTVLQPLAMVYETWYFAEDSYFLIFESEEGNSMD